MSRASAGASGGFDQTADAYIFDAAHIYFTTAYLIFKLIYIGLRKYTTEAGSRAQVDILKAIHLVAGKPSDRTDGISV